MHRLLSPLVLLLVAVTTPAQFQILQQIQNVGVPTAVYPVDANSDGITDLVTLASLSGFNLWLGTGGGAFGSLVSTSTRPLGSDWIDVGDVNGDRREDVVILGLHNSTQQWLAGVFFGQAGASFAAGPMSPAMSTRSHPRLEDVNGDGRLDLVYLTNDGTDIAVQLGDGAGGFAVASVTPVWPVAQDVALDDFDGDGDLDVALAVGPANLVQLLWGNGTGGFTRFSFVAVSGQNTSALTVADVDGNGAQDLIVVATASNELDLLRNDGFGNFSETGRFFTRLTPLVATYGDLDGDGHGDLAVGHGNVGQEFAWLRGDGTGNFNLVQSLPVPDDSFTRMTLADVDLDGMSEVLIAESSGRSVFVIGNPTSWPAGLAGYGLGTPGCRGGLGITGNSVPAVGNGSFGVVAANTPPRAFGLLALCTAQDPGGSDPLGAGALLHVSLSGAVFTKPFQSGTGRTAFAPSPIPSLPGLAGLRFYAQGAWLERRTGHVCTSAPLGFVTSQGLAITIQP